MDYFKKHYKGLTGALLFHLLLVVLLISLGLKNIPPQPEEGILINFGTTEAGSGLVEPSIQEEQQAPQPVKPLETTTSSQETAPVEGENVIQQNFEESAYLEQKANEQKEKDKQAKIEEDKRKKEKEKEELAQKQREEEIARKQKEEEEKRQKEEEQKQLMDKLAKSAFSGKNPQQTNSTGEGNTNKQGNQGNLNGDPNSTNRDGKGQGNEGISYSLEGRKAQELPKPNYSIQKEGRVVVEIFVDQSGKVIDAIPGKKGSTTTDAVLLEEARKAALKAKFNNSPNSPIRQQGLITYIYTLN